MRLEPFTPEEFERWRREAQDRFAELRAGTGTMTAAQAADRAAGIFTRLLPQGMTTPGHLVRRVLDDGGELVGDLWLQVDTDADQIDRAGGAGTDAFLYDIRLTPEAVARGLGTAAMDLAEQTARELGAAVLRVNVFTDDAATRALVEDRGFEPAATQMVLRLDGLRTGAGEPDAVQPEPRGPDHRTRGHVELRPMTPVQFDSFCATQVAGYAADLERSGTASGIRAQQKADADFAEFLPDGLRSPGQLFWTAYADGHTSGGSGSRSRPGPTARAPLSSTSRCARNSGGAAMRGRSCGPPSRRPGPAAR